MANPGGRGRPAAASPDQVLTVARRQLATGQRVDVRAIAAELGLGRATIYRWFGSRDGLLGELLVGEFRAMLRAAEAHDHRAGGNRVLDALDGFIRRLADNDAFRRFLELEPTALQLLTSGRGPVQPRIVAAVQDLITRAGHQDGYEPPVEPSTLAYALVRLGEAFLYTDTVVGFHVEVDRLREVQAALLGVPDQARRPKRPGRRVSS
jgi:AcrR family transcriptional regulator